MRVPAANTGERVTSRRARAERLADWACVYAALPIALFSYPAFTAKAFRVRAEEIVTGPVYSVLAIVGSDPFVV
ncbi:MAG: hypothetical protein UT05_C0005G0001 [Parcubacteria group bacterium GW2011_GWF2_38_76]|nr:MAG: hypothetical protein UT05_C0005G0001 [Parcubacteria group bacterium GW2011_GWF2_38_76]